MMKQPLVKESFITLLPKFAAKNQATASKYSLWLSQKYGGIFYKHAIKQTYYWITKKEIIEEILMNQAEYFVKPYAFETVFNKTFGAGGVFSTNDYHRWSEVKKPLASALHMDKVLNYSAAIINVTNKCIANLVSNKAQQVDLDKLLSSLTLEIAYSTVLQTESDPEHKTDHITRNILSVVDKELSNPLMKFLPARIFKRKYHKNIYIFNTIVKSIYAERISREKNPEDLINLLLSIYKDHGHDPTQKAYFLTQLKTLLVASHHTTSAFLSHALLVLAKRPEIAAKLYESIKTIDTNDEKAAMALLYCDYLQAFIKEVFRFYSIIRRIIRSVSKDIEICGVPFRKDTFLIIDMFCVHHDKDYWSEPFVFNPERFLVEGQQHDFLMPFGMGKRMCPGRHFALLELSIVLSLFIKAFSIESHVDVDKVAYEPGFVYKPKGPLYVKFKERQ